MIGVVVSDTIGNGFEVVWSTDVSISRALMTGCGGHGVTATNSEVKVDESFAIRVGLYHQKGCGVHAEGSTVLVKSVKVWNADYGGICAQESELTVVDARITDTLMEVGVRAHELTLYSVHNVITNAPIPFSGQQPDLD